MTALGVLLVGSSCGSDPNTVGKIQIPSDGMVRLVYSHTPAGMVTYAPSVYQLDAATTDAATVQDDQLIFPLAAAGGMAARQPGDILVSAVGAQNIFLAKIVSIDVVGTNLVVTFTQAPLTDAVESADLHLTIGAPPAPSATDDTVTSALTGSGGLFGNGTIDVSRSAGVACGPNMKCIVAQGQKIAPTLSGHVTPSASVDFDLKIDGFNVTHLLFVAHGSLDALATLGIKVENKGAYRLEVKLIEMKEPVLVGDIPTIVKAGLFVGAEGELYQPAVEYTLSAGYQVDVKAGFEMGPDHNFHGIYEQHTAPTADFERNGQITETKGKVYVALKVGWLLGVDIGPVTVIEAGPELAFRWYVQGDAFANGPTDGPWFETDVGRDISAVGTIDILGIVGGGISIKLDDQYDVLSKVPLPKDVFYFLPCFMAADGDYCGGETLNNFKLGTPGDPYECGGGQQFFDQACPNGCGPATGVDKAQGKRVACIPAANNPCHAAADGNYCGNETINGFIGGQLGLPASAQITCASGNVAAQISCSAGCGAVTGNARVGCLTASQGPNAPCGAGDMAGPNNGTCGPDGRVYYCYQGVWRVKDDCLAKQQICYVEQPGVADICVSGSSTGGGAGRPPSAACGAGDMAGPHNGTCGPDGRVYYCYQGVWYVKDDCIAKSESCVVQLPGVADICVAQSRRLTPPTAACGAGDMAGPNNGTCGPDGRVYYCYQGVWNLKDDCVARSVACVVEDPGVADVCAGSCGASSDCSAGETCTSGRCVCPGPVCGTSCCSADAWCGSGSRCCTGCAPGCPC